MSAIGFVNSKKGFVNSKKGFVNSKKGFVNSKKFWLSAVVSTAVMLSLGACRIHVDKDANGREKKVQVDTPFGGVHVNTDQTSAADLGLPVYPGATMVTDDDRHKSADVHLGFGQWQLRVKAVSYGTNDSRDQVAAFYKKALGRYGDVITCQGDQPVGTPTVTREGLNCTDDNKNHVKVNDGDMVHDYSLKAGSHRHQHIVGFENTKGDQTRFALVAIDLPSGMGNDDDDKQ